MISSNQDNRAKPFRAAYEEVRAASEESLLQELDSYELFVPRSDHIVTGLERDPKLLDNGLSDEKRTFTMETDRLLDAETPQIILSIQYSPVNDLFSQDLEDLTNVDDLLQQESFVWASHPVIELLAGQKTRNVSHLEQDIDNRLYSPYINWSTDPSDPEKDVGNISIAQQNTLQFSLQSSEQNVLSKIRNFVGYSPDTELKLQFASRWVIDKSIANERSNYDGAYKEVKI